MLENTEEAIKNGQSRKTDNIWSTRRRKTKQKHNTIFIGHHNTQTNKNNVNDRSPYVCIYTNSIPSKSVAVNDRPPYV